jgi:polyisoprenoid-binding protein YceI
VWQLDPARTVVAFCGRATRFSPTVRARFASVTGEVLTTGSDTSVVVDIDVRSMTSGNRAWDDVVGALDPFCADAFPTATYRSTAVVWHGSEAVVDGVLRLRGVERPVRLAARYDDLDDGRRLRIRAGAGIDREAFGVRCDVPGAGLLVPRRLELSVDVVAVHADARTGGWC